VGRLQPFEAAPGPPAEPAPIARSHSFEGFDSQARGGTLGQAKTLFAGFFVNVFGDRSQVVKVRLLVVIGIVMAFAVVGAGWKWSAVKQSPAKLAGWSWDGAMTDSEQA
jgi:hypothetical protein